MTLYYSLIDFTKLYSEIISISGTIITIISMIVTIIYTMKTKNYKKQAEYDIRKINLSNIVEKLKRTQEDIRKLPRDTARVRGIKIDDLFFSIKTSFDFSLNLLDNDSPDNEIRGLLLKAQRNLNIYETSYLSSDIDDSKILNITECIQNAIAKANKKIFKLEKEFING